MICLKSFTKVCPKALLETIWILWEMKALLEHSMMKVRYALPKAASVSTEQQHTKVRMMIGSRLHCQAHLMNAQACVLKCK